MADENFDGNILAGLRRAVPELDIVRVQDVGLRTADDPTILARPAERNRALLTHDVRTIPDFARARRRRPATARRLHRAYGAAGRGRVRRARADRRGQSDRRVAQPGRVLPASAGRQCSPRTTRLARPNRVEPAAESPSDYLSSGNPGQGV
ncbi:DUF5615 family PIN-like protein [Nocardioides gansuensis]|uniref:DUF5615 family PIN-like protein n=1 Tax=Nocardioides gansuensis TaxID=2138300 RepID=UPI003CCB7F3C